MLGVRGLQCFHMSLHGLDDFLIAGRWLIGRGKPIHFDGLVLPPGHYCSSFDSVICSFVFMLYVVYFSRQPLAGNNV